jgi:integrative and conjugative element protein (TIGR02256 family)
MIDDSTQHCPNETGGILVGRSRGDLSEVMFAVGPGLGAVHRRAHFRRDGNFSQQALDAIYERFAGEYDYLGEWHSHPVTGGPSPRDRESMRWIAQNERFNLDRPLLIICRRTWRQVWKPAGFQWSGGRLVRVPVVISEILREWEGSVLS